MDIHDILHQGENAMTNAERMADYTRKTLNASQMAEKHGNSNVFRFPAYKRQIMHTELPEPPEAA